MTSTNDMRHPALERAKFAALDGDYAGAKTALEGLLRLNPEDFDALRLLGNVCDLELHAANADMHDAGRDDDLGLPTADAKAYYLRALAVQPGNAWVLFDLGDWHSEHDVTGEASDYYLRALEQAKQVPDWESEFEVEIDTARRYLQEQGRAGDEG